MVLANENGRFADKFSGLEPLGGNGRFADKFSGLETFGVVTHAMYLIFALFNIAWLSQQADTIKNLYYALLRQRADIRFQLSFIYRENLRHYYHTLLW
mgnify:CR=1 FL=1